MQLAANTCLGAAPAAVRRRHVFMSHRVYTMHFTKFKFRQKNMNRSTFFRSLSTATALLALSACNSSAPADGSAANTPSSATTVAAQPTSSAAMDAFVARTNNVAPMQPTVLNKLAANVLASSKPGALCSLDTIDGSALTSTTNIKLDHTYVIGGWVVGSSKRAPVQFTLVLRGADTYGLESNTGISRADVAKTLGSDMAGTSGFNIESALSGLPDGTYQVLVLTKDQDGNELCDTERHFLIGR